MRTKTSNFGVRGRVGHDSSVFYDSKKYAQYSSVGNGKVVAKENKLKLKGRNKIYNKSSEHMSELPDNSIHQKRLAISCRKC